MDRISIAEPLQPIMNQAQTPGEPRPGDDQPQPVPGRDVPIQEPEPDRLPDEEPNPNPDENRDPPIQMSSWPFPTTSNAVIGGKKLSRSAQRHAASLRS